MNGFYSLGLLLSRASLSLSKLLNAKLSEANIDLPHSQFIVLRCLYYQDGLSQLEIAGLLFKDTAAIKRTIDNLESKGYAVRKQIHAQKNMIYITDAGKELMPSVLAISENLISKVLQNFEEEERAQLKDMLERIFINTKM